MEGAVENDHFDIVEWLDKHRGLDEFGNGSVQMFVRYGRPDLVKRWQKKQQNK